MDSFLKKFFPTVYIKKHQAKANNYCKYNNQYLQLFASSLYFAAIVASFFASVISKKFGRKPTIQVASILFLSGAVLNAAAQNLAMLIAGRMLLGAGVGFGNQVAQILTAYELLLVISIILTVFLFRYLLSVSGNANAGSSFVHIRNCTSKE